MIGWWITNFGILGVGFAWIIYEIKGINTRIDGVNGRIDSVNSSLNARIDKHEQQCEARHKDFIKYMKEHEGRISRVEARLDERQQQPAT